MRRGMICGLTVLIILSATGASVQAGDLPSSSTQPQRDDGRAIVRPPTAGPVSLFPQHLQSMSDTSQLHLSGTRAVQPSLSSRFQEKQRFAGKPNVVTKVRQGGDRIDDALAIAVLPFSDVGTTEGYSDDYNESCPDVPGSPDIVYQFRPDTRVMLTVGLCGSYYDTRLWAYENQVASWAVVACNDDYCGSGSVVDFWAEPGNTYYIVIDGYSGAYGQYQLEVTPTYPVNVVCPEGAVDEGEACLVGAVDALNGGCNSSPEVFSPIDVDDTVCGTSWTTYDYRDTDWYLRTFTADTQVTWYAVADFPTMVAIIDLGGGCYDPPYRYSFGDAGDTVAVTWRLRAGTYAFFVAPSAYETENDCTSGASKYVAWMRCQQPPPAPANDRCDAAQPIGDVSALEFSTADATWDGGGYYIYDTPDIWYCYTASCNGTVTVDLCDVDYDSKVVVYDGCTCPPYYELAYSDDYCGYGSKVAFAATAGRTYLIQVGGCQYNGMPSGTGRMTIRCQPAPPNSFCENVTPVTLPATFEGDAAGAVNTCGFFWGGQVWVAFTIDTCMDVRLSYCGTAQPHNSWATLVRGCPCNDFVDASRTDYNSCSDGNATMVWYQLKPGTYYYPVLDDPYYSNGPYHIEVYGDTVTCAYCRTESRVCDEYIARVTLGDLDNSSGCDHYADYTSLSTNVYKSTNNTLTVENGSSAWGSDRCGAWIDWNHDLDFDDYNEWVYFTNSSGKGPYTADVYVPAEALPGATRMRVQILWNTWPYPCGEFSYGEAEDYTVVVDEYLCGDIDGNMVVDVNDISCLVDYYIEFGPKPEPWQAGDCNCDGIVDLADIEALVMMLASGYVPPCCPTPQAQQSK